MLAALPPLTAAVSPIGTFHYPHLGEKCSHATRERDCGTQLVCLPWGADDSHIGTHVDSVCGECTETAQCDVAPEQVCRREHAYYICAHKTLFPYLDARDLAGFALTFVAAAVAAGGGIGGGGLLVPLFVLVLAFTPHDATPLSNVAVLGGSLANLLLNWRRSHPAAAATPLIEFEVALMMEPTTIAGALIGVVLNKIFPGWLVTLLMVVLLGLTARRTFKKGLAAWQKESAAAAAPPAAEALLPAAPLKPAHEASPLEKLMSGLVAKVSPASRLGRPASWPPGGGGDAASAAEVAAAIEAAADPAEQIREARLKEFIAGERWTRAGDVATLVCLLLGCFALAIMRGRNMHDSLLHIRCGSSVYWALIGVQMLVVVLCALAVRYVLMARHAKRVALRYPFRPDQVLWTQRNTILYPLTCTAAGLCAGMFGIGGGIIKGPLMLEMGMHPQVSSATAAYMILFTSAAATMEYAIFGALRPHYGAALFGLGFLGTVVGHVVVGAMLRRSGKESIIVLIIASIIGASAALMGAIGLFNFIHALQLGEDQGLRALCEPEAPDR